MTLSTWHIELPTVKNERGRRMLSSYHDRVCKVLTRTGIDTDFVKDAAQLINALLYVDQCPSRPGLPLSITFLDSRL